MRTKRFELPIIVNAKAGRIAGRLGTRQELIEAMAASSMPCRILETPTGLPDDDFYLEALRGSPPFVVVSGGDGTLHQALTGFWRAHRKDGQSLPPIMLVPSGTMNVIAGQFGLGQENVSLRLRRALERRANDEPLPNRSVRTLEVNGEIGCIYGCGLAYDLMRRYYEGCGGARSRVTAIFAQVMLPWNGTEKFSVSADLSVSCECVSRHWGAATGILAGTVTEVGFGVPLLKQESGGSGSFLMRLTRLTIRQLAGRLSDLRHGRRLPDTNDMALSEAILSFAAPQPYLVDGDLKPNGGTTHVLRLGPAVTLLE